MNREVYTLSERIIKPSYFEMGGEYMYFEPFAKKKDIKKPVKIKVLDIDYADGMIINLTYKNTMLGTTHKAFKSTLDHTIFFLKDALKLEGLYYKQLNRYNESQLLKRDIKFMQEFRETYPEYVL